MLIFWSQRLYMVVLVNNSVEMQTKWFGGEKSDQTSYHQLMLKWYKAKRRKNSFLLYL
jgi:hypothetical protein